MTAAASAEKIAFERISAVSALVRYCPSVADARNTPLVNAKKAAKKHSIKTEVDALTISPPLHNLAVIYIDYNEICI